MRSAPKSSDSWDAYARKLGESIHRQRIARGYSQDRVAYEAGLSRYTYQKLEKGESRPGTPSNPTMKTVIAISQVLNVTLQDLLPPTPPDLTAR
jgi:transcriptional regulator with XRE-family HTH domain